MTTRGTWRPLAALLMGLCLWASAPSAHAQARPTERDAKLTWSEDHGRLLLRMAFRDVVDPTTERKLARGLPTIILFTGVLYAEGAEEPIATTLQTCRITWHVWEEMYLVELTQSNAATSTKHWTPTVTGVLRRCAEVDRLVVAESAQVPANRALSLQGRVLVNPVSKKLLKKIKRWVSRPARTATASPGSALFSTFTGLFMQRIGEAERVLEFVTKAARPE